MSPPHGKKQGQRRKPVARTPEAVPHTIRRFPILNGLDGVPRPWLKPWSFPSGCAPRPPSRRSRARRRLNGRVQGQPLGLVRHVGNHRHDLADGPAFSFSLTISLFQRQGRFLDLPDAGHGLTHYGRAPFRLVAGGGRHFRSAARVAGHFPTVAFLSFMAAAVSFTRDACSDFPRTSQAVKRTAQTGVHRF